MTNYELLIDELTASGELLIAVADRVSEVTKQQRLTEAQKNCASTYIAAINEQIENLWTCFEDEPLTPG